MVSTTSSIMNRPQIFERCFLALGFIGFTLLWPVMIYNGTIIALLQAAWTGVYRDSRPLLTTYTRFPPLDFIVSVLVAFFDDQINGTDNGAWYLMLNLVTTIQAASLWVLIEASRMSQKKWRLELFFIWPLLWNLFGTAPVLPAYLYLHTKNTKFGKLSPAISTARSRSLMVVSILGASSPVLSLFSAYGFGSDFTRHAVIAYFVFSPLFLGALVAMVSSRNSKSPGNYRTSGNQIRYLYIFAALASGGAHIYTLVTTWLSQDQSVKFGRIFIPSPSGVIPRSIDNIHTGALLFLQYDWIVVNVTCAAWVYLLVDSHQLFSGVQGLTARVLLILVSTLLIGPGATVSCALYLREENLLVRYRQTSRR